MCHVQTQGGSFLFLKYRRRHDPIPQLHKLWAQMARQCLGKVYEYSVSVWCNDLLELVGLGPVVLLFELS